MCVLLERHNTLPRPVQIPYPDSQMSNASGLPSQRGWGGIKERRMFKLGIGWCITTVPLI